MEEAGEQLLLVNHRTFSKNKNQLGAYGRKLLMSSIAYDPCEYVEAALLSIFKQTVQASLGSKNTRSNDEIIECLYRVERFSDQFKKRILDKISLARALL